MSLKVGAVLSVVAFVAGLAFSLTARAEAPQQERTAYVSLCSTTPEGLASFASGRNGGSPVGGAFVHRDQVCILWKNH